MDDIGSVANPFAVRGVRFEGMRGVGVSKSNGSRILQTALWKVQRFCVHWPDISGIGKICNVEHTNGYV